MDTAGVIAIRVDTQNNTVQCYYNARHQAEYTVKEGEIKDMKDIRARAFVYEGDIVELVWYWYWLDIDIDWVLI